MTLFKSKPIPKMFGFNSTHSLMVRSTIARVTTHEATATQAWGSIWSNS